MKHIKWTALVLAILLILPSGSVSAITASKSSTINGKYYYVNSVTISDPLFTELDRGEHIQETTTTMGGTLGVGISVSASESLGLGGGEIPLPIV